jgi:hypothetical protein
VAFNLMGGSPTRQWINRPLRYLLSNEDAEYRVASSEKPGFTVIKEYEYFNWMPPTFRNFVVLRREFCRAQARRKELKYAMSLSMMRRSIR